MSQCRVLLWVTVVESLNDQYPVGSIVMGRTSWEQYSIADGSDLMSILEPDPGVELHEYLCSLGPSGMTAYFGIMDIGQPKQGDLFVINAAAGGIGCIAGQIAKAEGCTTVGIAGGQAKCQWLQNTLGYDQVIDYKSAEPFEQQLQKSGARGYGYCLRQCGVGPCSLPCSASWQKTRVLFSVVLCPNMSEMAAMRRWAICGS